MTTASKVKDCEDCLLAKNCDRRPKIEVFSVARKTSKKVKNPQKTRVLTPEEFALIENEIPKFSHKLLFRVAFATGMRYEELIRFAKEGRNWLVTRSNKLFIHLPEEHKTERTMRERWIRLSNWGESQVKDLFSQKPIPQYPTYTTWQENLHRWAQKAGVCPLYLSAKTSRKTWESWLIFYCPEKFPLIILSQGHTAAISFAHYQNLAYSEKDKEKMSTYLEGWA